MSKQILVDYIPFEVTPQQINESMEQNGGRLVVNGVLQTFFVQVFYLACLNMLI